MGSVEVDYSAGVNDFMKIQTLHCSVAIIKEKCNRVFSMKEQTTISTLSL